LRRQLPDSGIITDDDIPKGVDWLEWITTTVPNCHALIAVVGPDWETGAGRRNIHSRADVVRREIKIALDCNIRVFPVLVDRGKVRSKDLPVCLRRIKRSEFVFAARRFNAQIELAKLLAELMHLREALRPKPIVLISSTLAYLTGQGSSEGLDFFTTLATSATQQLHSKGYDVILKVPHYHVGPKAVYTTEDSQVELLTGVVDGFSNYAGLLIAPFATAKLRDRLIQLRKVAPDLPIVTIDKEFEAKAFRKEHVPPPAASIGDGVYNGRLAASSIIQYLQDVAVDHPTIVALQGIEGSAGRIRGFRRAIEEYNKDLSQSKRVHLAISHQAPFLRQSGAALATDYLGGRGTGWSNLNDVNLMEAATTTEQSRAIHAFFCCNDEMALGARDTLESRLIGSPGELNEVVIVGYDGIAPVAEKVVASDLWLLNTVDVKLKEQVEEAIRIIARGTRTRLVRSLTQGVLVQSLDAQREHVRRILNNRAEIASRLRNSK